MHNPGGETVKANFLSLGLFLVLVACGGELGKKYYTLPPEAQDLRAGDNFRGIVRDQEGNVLACDGPVEILPEVGFERLIDAKYCLPGTQFASPTPRPFLTPTMGTAVACAAAAEVVDSSLRVNPNWSGLAQALEELGWCGKKVTIFLLDVDRWETGVAPLTEGDVIGFPVFPSEWIPEEGRKCGMKIEVDWLTFLNCVMLHEMRHLQHYAEGRDPEDPTVETEADEWALANFQRIRVLEAEGTDCGERVEILDRSERLDFVRPRDNLSLVLADLGFCNLRMIIEFEDVDEFTTDPQDPHKLRAEGLAFTVLVREGEEEFPIIHLNIPPLLAPDGEYYYGYCGIHPAVLDTATCRLLHELRKVWQWRQGAEYDPADAEHFAAEWEGKLILFVLEAEYMESLQNP